MTIYVPIATRRSHIIYICVLRNAIYRLYIHVFPFSVTPGHMSQTYMLWGYREYSIQFFITKCSTAYRLHLYTYNIQDDGGYNHKQIRTHLYHNYNT